MKSKIIYTIFKKSYRKHLLFAVLLIASIGMQAQPQTLWGSGSRDLYPINAEGGRAVLYSSTVNAINIPFPNHGVHYVYAEAGETIALASSVQAYGSRNNTRNQHRNRIRLYGPNGAQITLSVGNNNDTFGRISDRDAEIAGPALPDATATGNQYVPLYHTVTQTGIYKVEFYATNTSGGTVSTGRPDSGLMANSSWTQKTSSNYIWAWDVSVANAAKTAWIPGRVYTNVMNMDNNQQSFTHEGSQFPNGFFGVFNVLTRDGYVYNVRNNGLNGLVFTFMVNNRGFHMEGDPNTPSYKSVHGSSLTNSAHAYNRYSDPNALDTGSIVTHKIFYSLPAEDLPESSIGAVPGGQTWLRIPELLLEVSDLKVVGAEGSPNQVGSKGAYVEFFNETGGDYHIVIHPKAGSNHNFPQRVLSGPSVIGQNSIYWDGNDGAGNPLPAGISQVDVDIQVKGAEVHFPYMDVEQNSFGIIIELLETDLQSVRSDFVYWDDRDIDRNITGKANPINNSHTTNPAGISSSINGHKWATGTNTSTSGTWGDERGIDTYTFIEGDKVSVEFDVDVKIVDLYTEVSHTIAGVPNAVSGQNGQAITFEVVAGSHQGQPNEFSDHIDGATFQFIVPVGVDINPNPVSSVVTGGLTVAQAISYDPVTRTFTAKYDMDKGSKITYTFQGTLNGLMGDKFAEATILRPNDVKDIDATNTVIEIPPTSAYFECYYNDGSNLGLSCNNVSRTGFMLLEDCTESVLFHENFDRPIFDANNGRLEWNNIKAVDLDANFIPVIDANGAYIRNGSEGWAHEAYTFAPGFEDPGYAAAEALQANVARVLHGYYTVVSPSWMQNGIPDTDPWHNQLGGPNPPAGDYDWLPSWMRPEAVRDVSGRLDGAVFHLRGAIDSEESIKSFFEFELPMALQENEIYDLSLYSYFIEYTEDYLIMDVVDVNTGEIYATKDLVYAGVGSSPADLNWIPLSASFSFGDTADCGFNISEKSVKIAIRGSHTKALASGTGFGHALLDDISFVHRSSTCGTADVIACTDACFDEVDGETVGAQADGLNELVFNLTPSPAGYMMDFYYVNAPFNLQINGVSICDITVDPSANLRFSDGAKWGDGNLPNLADLNLNQPVDLTDITNPLNPTPILRVYIDNWGNSLIYGARNEGGSLEEMEVFDNSGIQYLNRVHWNTDNLSNLVVFKQNNMTATSLKIYSYGLEEKECDTCEFYKDGEYKGDEFAIVGDIVTYTFEVKNLGNMDIYDVVITDPLFGNPIEIIQDTNGDWVPNKANVSFTGDVNNNGVLNRYEVWTIEIDYEVTSDDIFQNKGVYNRATVTGEARKPITNSPVDVDIDSTDPTPYDNTWLGWDPSRPDHTFVPLKGSGLLITNPHIKQKTK